MSQMGDGMHGIGYDSGVTRRGMLMLGAGALFSGFVGSRSRWGIVDPYAGVDWGRHIRCKANFHTHTTMSDGGAQPADVIDLYAKMGYGALALTDHDTVGPKTDRKGPDRHKTTWPWQAFGREPEEAGMVAIEGNEISRLHHTGSFFCDYGDANVASEEDAVREIGVRNGLAMLFHPGRYSDKKTVEWYVKMYRTFPHLFGMEIYNCGDRYSQDRVLWDTVLTRLVAERPVWGFSNDDMHNPALHAGHNWNVMLVPELTSGALRRAMEGGVSFYVFAPEGHNGPPPPEIRAVSVDRCEGVISLDVTGHKRVEWISEGRKVHEGASINLDELDMLGSYVRATVYSASGGPLIGTQPFVLCARPRLSAAKSSCVRSGGN
ncbi:MAG: hypothetical protein PHU80_08825 [Kiritimatiellae bacterium]|nr:hypothetical protein [Kiritimatiellia bacterium]